MESNLRTFTSNLKDTKDIISNIFHQSFGVPLEKSEKLVEKRLGDYFNLLEDNLFTVIEYPYVDKIYRDTYYHFFSSKHSKYHRNSIRISFFTKAVSLNEFRDESLKNELQNNNSYLGFLTLRPTVPNIIGRSGISRVAFKKNNFRMCVSKINTTVASAKFNIHAFPHASQDGQTMTCAETTIWSLMEYFGNKYPEYKPVLPSQIHNILRKYSFKRQIPSDGLTAEQLSYAIRELGFGSVFYSRSKFENEFDEIVSTYIESGIPIIAVIKDDKIGHAVNIIGREEIDQNAVVDYPVEKNIENSSKVKLNIIDFHKHKRNYVFIDDNHPPYRLGSLDTPCYDYSKDDFWKECKITNIIVPLYAKIYLEANRARQNIFRIIKSRIGIEDSEKRIIRTFLASSRSYKNYIALNPKMNETLKICLINLTMPKFIWICEISKEESFRHKCCDDLIILDATEPADYHHQEELGGNTPIMAAFINGQFSTENFGIFNKIDTFASSFNIYEGNLSTDS